MESIKSYYEGLVDPDTVYTYDDYLNEFGYNGELYACYEEFCNTEYNDEAYMRELLKDNALIGLYYAEKIIRENSNMETLNQHATYLEEEATQLAVEIDTFAKEFDFYEYTDQYSPGEDGVEEIKADLKKGNVGYLQEWFRPIVEDNDSEMYDRAVSINERLRKFDKLQEHATVVEKTAWTNKRKGR